MECDVSLKDRPNHPERAPNYEMPLSKNYQTPPLLTTQQLPSTHNQKCNHPSANYDTDRPPVLQPEDEDPLAFDELAVDSSLRLDTPPKLVKHTHCLRRHVPRLNAKLTTEKSPSSSEKSEKLTRSSSAQASTMREVLASIPGFRLKPRRRSNKKMSTAAQIEQTKDGKIDLETPDSVLVGTNLRALLNKHTFSLLPPLFQHNLVQLLPSVDRPPVDCDPSLIRLSASSLNNEFFARACLEWRDRLSEGEFTPENQVKLKTEAEKEKSKLDPWKLKHFEPIWGSKQDQPSHKTTIKLKPPTSLEGSSTPSTSSGVFGSPSSVGETNTIPQPSTSNSPKRLRTVGAITRAQQQQALVSSSEPSQKTLTVRKEKDECDSGIEEIVAETAEKVVPSSRSVEISQLNKIVASESKAVGEDVENSFARSDANEVVLFEIEASSVDTTSETTTQSGENSLQNLAEKKSSRACNNQSSLKFDELELEKNENSITASSSCDTKGNDRYSDDNDNAAAEPFDEKTCNSLDLASKLDLSKCRENRKDGDELLLTDYQQTGSHTSASQIDRGASDHLFADMYKLQNFNGLLQNAFNIQNTSMFGNHQQQQSAPSHIAQQNIHQIPTSSSHDIVESFIVSDLASDGGVGAMLTCSEETTSSTSGLVDCSADNTAIDELEPSIQNLPIEDDPIEQKFADAENYVLESGNNEDYSSLQKRAPKRSSSPEYNDGKQLKFNESVDRQENENSTTQVSADQKRGNLLEMRYSDSDNAETLDEKTCQTVDLDSVKFDLGGEILYSIESDKIDPDDILSSEYHHGENNANQVGGISTIDATEGSKTTENLFADMYKLQNFNGLLHNAFNVQQNFGHQIHHHHQQAVQQMSHQMPTSSSAQDCIVESFIVSDLVNSGGSGGGSSGSVGAMLTCSDETSSSTSGLVDCSGDNSADDNAIEEIEQSIQNIPIEDDPIEQKFADAQHYVMESGEISTDSGEASSLAMTDTNKMREETDGYSDSIEQAIPSTATMTLVRNSNVDAANSNYDLQHSDQKRQQQQMAMCTTSSTSLSTCSVSISGNSSSSSSSSSMSSSSAMPEAASKVDIYQNVAHDWNFGMKIESNQSDMGEIDTAPDDPLLDNQNQCSDEIVGHLDDSNTVRDTGNIYHNHLHNQHRQTLFETASNEQIKTESEMPMTAAEMEVSSTVASNSNDSSSDQSINESVHSGKILTQPTNNFVVHQMHQPNLAFQQNSAGVQQQIQNCNNSQLTGQYVSQLQQQVQPQMTFNFQPQQQANMQQHYIENQQQQQQIQSNIQMPLNPLQQQQQVVNKLTQKSSTIPATNMQQQRNPANIPSAYLSLSSSQPLKVIPNVVNNPGIPTTIAQQRPKLPPNSGKGRRSSNKLPPGAVNLERSYQICQAVIQNSPNRHQLTAQLRPPASLLAANSGSSSSASNSNSPTPIKKDVPPAVTSSNRTMYKVIGPRLKKYAQRQPSPTSLIRHVYATSPNGTVPGNPALPMGIHQQSGQLQGISPGQQQQQHQQQSALIQGQYVLIHRANVGAADNQAPRASSAPPAQNQQIHGVNGVPISGRGRPASVDVDSPNTLHEIQMAGPNPGVQAVTRRTINNQGLSYGDPIMDPSHQNYMVNTGGENSPPNCPCSLNPMVICQQCGAFCHDDCISPAKLCVACVIR